MTREECKGCDAFGYGSPMMDDHMPVCKHEKVLNGIGIWIARIKECPKEKVGDQE